MRIIIKCSDVSKAVELDVAPGVEAYALLHMLGSIDVPIETEAEKHADSIIDSMIDCLEIWASWRG